MASISAGSCCRVAEDQWSVVTLRCATGTVGLPIAKDHGAFQTRGTTCPTTQRNSRRLQCSAMLLWEPKISQFSRKWWRPNWNTILAFVWSGWVKQATVTTAGVLVQIWAVHRSCTSLLNTIFIFPCQSHAPWFNPINIQANSMNYSNSCYVNFYIPLFVPLLQISDEDLKFFCDVTLCCCMRSTWYLEGSYRLHLQGQEVQGWPTDTA